MSIEVRDFETMVESVLDRIVASNTGLTNIYPGSVIRTIVEAILAESDIQYYQIQQLYGAMGIDDAEGEDLDRLVSVLGIVRKSATKCTGTVTFGRSTESLSDIAIQYAQVVATRPSVSGDIIEFMVTATDAELVAGQLTVDVAVEALVAGNVYIAADAMTIMGTPIIGIEYVTNGSIISGGLDEESDDDLRDRAKNALSALGKGTNNAIRNALLAIPGVLDAMMIDMSRGVGTSDVVVVTDTIPPSTELSNLILDTIADTKASGIDIDVVYPTIVTVDVTVTTTGGTSADIGTAITEYFSTLAISETFIKNQMERYVLNKLDDTSIDITTSAPANNVTITGTQIIRAGTITINGVVWNG